MKVAKTKIIFGATFGWLQMESIPTDSFVKMSNFIVLKSIFTAWYKKGFVFMGSFSMEASTT